MIKSIKAIMRQDREQYRVPRRVENRLLGVETNITNWQRRQNSNNNFSAVIPYDMELQRKESKEFLDDLTTRDQRMMVAVLTMVITADSKEQLDADTDAIRSLSGQRMCQMAVLNYQQLDGLNTALPIGVRKINTFRTLTTESLAVFMPFKVQEIMDRGGIYFGENAISHNLIMCNKANLLNQASFRLGVPGSGKSFSVKEEIAFLLLNTDDDILICDPEGEYAPLVEAMGDMGTVIRVAAGGNCILLWNPTDSMGNQTPIKFWRVKAYLGDRSLSMDLDSESGLPLHLNLYDPNIAQWLQYKDPDTLPDLAQCYFDLLGLEANLVDAGVVWETAPWERQFTVDETDLCYRVAFNGTTLDISVDQSSTSSYGVSNLYDR